MTQKTFSQKMFMMSPMCFFYETHVKAAIKGLNKNSSPGPDKITPVLIQNGGENFTKSLPYIEIAISQDIFQNFGNKITGHKPDKENQLLPNSHRSISLSNFVGKVYEKIIQQEAINFLTENIIF